MSYREIAKRINVAVGTVMARTQKLQDSGIIKGYSAIIDHRWTAINDSNYLKLVLWYDNEWAYICRVLDLSKKILKI